MMVLKGTHKKKGDREMTLSDLISDYSANGEAGQEKGETEMGKIVECESCAEGGQHGVPAVGHSKNPDWSGYNLCQECIDEYDSRPFEKLAGEQED